MRGLKYYIIVDNCISYKVAPFAGAWIEINKVDKDFEQKMSHPSRVRGLKYHYNYHINKHKKVAPFAGAWIEIQ